MSRLCSLRGRPIFSRFTRSSFPFPSPSDACHAGYDGVTDGDYSQQELEK